MKKYLSLLLFVVLFTNNLSAQNKSSALIRMFDVGVYSDAMHTGNDCMITNYFLSVKKNNIELLNVSEMEADGGVMFIVERSTQFGLRLFIMNSENKKILSCATLKKLKTERDGEYDFYLFDATFDKLMGYSNKNVRLSFFCKKNITQTMDSCNSIMMSINDNLVIEILGLSIDVTGKPTNMSNFLK